MRILENHFYLTLMITLRHGFLVALLLTAGCNLYAQKKIDSLENILKRTDLADSSRVKALIALSAQYEYSDLIKSRKLTEEAITIIDEKALPELKGAGYKSLASIYRVTGDFRGALKADNLALEAGVMNKDSALIANSFNNVGEDYFDLGDYDEAYHYFTASYRVAQKINDPLRIAIALHNVGRVFKELGQYQTATNQLTLSRKMSAAIKDYEGEPYSLGELGDVLLRKG
jgi:tetratricopeptide (TPR) repeat protein